LAYPKLTGKAKLENDLAQLKVKVKQAQDELNRTVNGVPLKPGTPAYIAADKKFTDAIADRDAAQDALTNYVEPTKPVKKKSAKQIEAERQDALINGPADVVETTGATGATGNTNAVVKSANVPVEDFIKNLDTAGAKTINEIKSYLGLKNLDGKLDIKLVDAISKKENDLQTLIDATGRDIDRLSYYKTSVDTGAGKDERYEPYGQQQIYNRSTAEGVIDSIFTSLNLGREASASEIDTLYKQLQAEQKKSSSMSKGTYKMVDGRRVLVQESGLDARTFLENKVRELPAYKESQAAKSEKSKIDLASTALANGYNLDADFATQLPGWLDAINNGKSVDEFKNIIRASARRILPEAIRNQIAPDEDLTTTFSTYMSNIAKAKGVPVSTINVNDVIPLATNDKGFADYQEFEKKKRSQAWWDGSPEGFAVTTTYLNDTLKDFGLLGQGVRTA
jgi:hypothetical protein